MWILGKYTCKCSPWFKGCQTVAGKSCLLLVNIEQCAYFEHDSYKFPLLFRCTLSWKDWRKLLPVQTFQCWFVGTLIQFQEGLITFWLTLDTFHLQGSFVSIINLRLKVIFLFGCSAPHALLAMGKVDPSHPDLAVDPLNILRPHSKLVHQLPLVMC